MKPIRRLTRTLAGVGAWTMWTPPLLLAGWSGVYLWNVLEYASAPGIPVVFEYEASGGTVTVKAKSYTADVNQRVAVIDGLEIFGPDGYRLAKVDRARVEQGESGGAKVLVVGVDLLLDRLPNGQFSLLRVIPKAPEEKGPETAVDVVAKDVLLRYRDRTGGSQLNLSLRSQALTAVGAGASWLVSGEVVEPRIGRVPLDLNISETGAFRGDFYLKNNDLTPLLPVAEKYLRPGENLGFGFTRSSVSGQISVDTTKEFVTRIYGRPSLSVTNFRSGDVSGDFRGDLQLIGARAMGALQGKLAGLDVNLRSLGVDWSESVVVRAKGTAKLARLADLPSAWRRNLPRGTEIRAGSFEGDVAWQQNRWLADGKIRVGEGKIAGERISSVAASGLFSPSLAIFDVQSASWNRQNLRGLVRADLKTGSTLSWLDSRNADLGALGRQFRLPISGRGPLQLIVASDRRGAMTLNAASRGQLSVQIPDGPRLSGAYQMALRGNSSKIWIESASLRGEQGDLALSGSFEPQRGTLDLAFKGGRVEAKTFAPDVDGQAFFEGSLSGTFQKPKYASEIDVYRLKAGEFEAPLVRLVAKGDLDQVEFSEIEGQVGLSKVRGAVSLDFSSGRLSGKFESPGIQLAEVIGDRAAGIVRISDGQVSGSLKDPKINARLEGGPIAFEGATLSGIQGRLFATNDFLRIAQATLEVSDADTTGTVRFTGDYRLSTQSGNAEATWENLPLRPLAQLDERFSVQGLSTGTGKFAFNESGLKDGLIEGNFVDIALNGQVLGSGPFKVEAKNSEVVANGAIGSIERFIELSDLRQNSSGDWDGRLRAFQLRGEALVRLARPLWKDAPEDTRQLIADLTGTVDGNFQFGLRGSDLLLKTEDLLIEGLASGGRALGDVKASVERKSGEWHFNSVDLTEGDQKIALSGSVFDDGTLNLEGDANKVDLSLVSLFAPKAPVVAATADASFQLNGKADNPELLASLKISGNTGENAPDGPPSVNFDVVELKDRKIWAEGGFFANGFTGRATVNAALDAFFSKDPSEREEGEQFEVRAQLASRPIEDFQSLIKDLDLERSRGTVGGSVVVAGTVDSYRIDGGIRFGEGGSDDQIALKNVRTALKNPLLSLSLEDGKLKLVAEAESTAGGSASVNAEIPAQWPEGGDLAEWLRTTAIAGTVSFREFGIDEGDPARRNVIQSKVSTFEKDGNGNALKIAGTLKEPTISGRVQTGGLSADIPEVVAGEGTFEPPINPKFDIDVISNGGVRLRTFNLNLLANAEGTIRGTLLKPEVNGDLLVRDGTLKLPNARIQLEENGLVNFSLRPGPDNTAIVEVPVNLTGRTNVSARLGTTSYQRYDITLFVTGDLIQQGDLQILGRSDPSGLSQSEIMAIIGQRDLIEALVAGAQDTRSDQFRGALLGLFLPTLSDQVTQPLAQALDLDYLAIDYNSFEGAVLSTAKSFNRFLTAEGRRVLNPTPFLRTPLYELRLVYRIPSRSDLLGRARFVLSTDNIRPYRVSIEYSFRL